MMLVDPRAEVRVYSQSGVCRPHDARLQNLTLITQMLYDGDGISRAQMARLTGLAPVTVSSLVSILTSRGLIIEEASSAPGRPGRPGTTLHLDADALAIIALDLTEPGRLTAASCSLRGHIRDRVTCSLGEDASALAGLVSAVEELRASAGKVIGLGVGLPAGGARADAADGSPEWNAARLIQKLGSGSLPISVGEGAGLSALAERRFGGFSRSGNLVRVALSDRVTVGLLLDGSPLPGRADALSHSEVPGSATPCVCGRRGCVETVLPVPALAAHVAADPVRREQTLVHAGRTLGAVLRPIIGLLCIDELIVSGPEELIDESFLTAVEGAASQYGGEPRAGAVRAQRSGLGDDAVLLGAAALVMQDELGIR